MKKSLRKLLPVLLIAGSVAVVMGLIAASKDKKSEKKDEAVAAVLVETVQARLESLNLSIISQGTVRPRTETILMAQVPGKIIAVSPHFIAGGFFRKGEVLLQIDPSDFEGAVKSARASLASREAKLSEENARSKQALKDWVNLGRKGEPSDLTIRIPQLAEAQAGVDAAQADLQKAQRDLARTSISLPYDGLVRSKRVDIGQYLGAGSQLGVTFAIATAEIRLPLSSRDLVFLQLPSAVDLDKSNRPQVRLTAESSGVDSEWQAEIIRTEGVVDETSRVIYAVAEIIDPYAVLGESTQEELKIGTFVKAEIEGLRADNIIVLPRSVLKPNNTLLVANAENKLEIRKVDVLRAEPQRVFITSGIEAGEHVVTTAMDAPIPGTVLNISGETSAVATEIANAGDSL